VQQQAEAVLQIDQAVAVAEVVLRIDQAVAEVVLQTGQAVVAVLLAVDDQQIVVVVVVGTAVGIQAACVEVARVQTEDLLADQVPTHA